MKKLITILLCFVLLLGLSSCGGNEKKRYEGEFAFLFDTVTRVIAYTDTKEEFSGRVQLIYDSLEEYHQLYDIYNNYEGINNIKTINDNAGVEPVKVDKRIIDLLLYAKKANEETDGNINIALGSVLKIWHQHRIEGIDEPEKASLPEISDLEEAAKHADINQLIIDEEKSTVFIKDPEMSLDVGAIAKGYATEQVAQIAMEAGLDAFLLSVGGNVRAVGTKADNNEPWAVGVRNPQMEEGNDLFLTNLTDASLVTSGIYERSYTVDGKEYHHIINPKTLYPAEYFAAVSIITPDSGMADALSTAIFNLPYEEGLKIIEKMPTTEAVWVFNSGEVKFSSNFEEYIKK